LGRPPLFTVAAGALSPIVHSRYAALFPISAAADTIYSRRVKRRDRRPTQAEMNGTARNKFCCGHIEIYGRENYFLHYLRSGMQSAEFM
jgi:hypothetical protein